MKWMIASDIHGSAYWCGKLIESFKTEQPDRMILLGDLLYHGPRNNLPEEYSPKTVIDMLNSIADRLICVRGNCESEVDQMVLDFPCLSDYCIINDNDLLMYATHGHHFGECNPPKQAGKFLLLCGHTHVAKFKDYDNYLYLNPGSVSIPKEKTKRGYIIIENNTAVWKTLDGEAYLSVELF